jgi:hypothetical protein
MCIIACCLLPVACCLLPRSLLKIAFGNFKLGVLFKIRIHADFEHWSFTEGKTPAKALETAASKGEPSQLTLLG